MWGWGYFVLQDILNICDRVLRIRGVFYLFKLILSTTYLFLNGFAEYQEYQLISTLESRGCGVDNALKLFLFASQ